MSFNDYKTFIEALLSDTEITTYVDNRIEPQGSKTEVIYPKIIVFPVTTTTENYHARRHKANRQIQISIRSKDPEITEKISDLVKYCVLKDNPILNAAKIRNAYLASEVDIFTDPVFQKSIRISFNKIEKVR